jgi:hypothetical protein
MGLGPGVRPSGPKAVPSTILCPLPDSPMNVRSSTHLMRAFIKATHNHQSPIANHNASKLRGFKIGANGPGGAWVLCAYSSLQGAAWPKRPPSMLRPDKPVLNRVKIGEGFGRP